MARKSSKGSIDTTMKAPAVPALDSAPGVYNRHPNLGPAGESGGFPLKFTDESVKTPNIAQAKATMNPTPAAISNKK